jgi:hypothetical protein
MNTIKFNAVFSRVEKRRINYEISMFPDMIITRNSTLSCLGNLFSKSFIVALGKWVKCNCAMSHAAAAAAASGGGGEALGASAVRSFYGIH